MFKENIEFSIWVSGLAIINTLRPRQNGRHFPDDILKCIFLNENVWIWIEISLNFVPKDPINNIPALVQIMAWRRQGNKPLSEPMMVRLLTHICVTRPQWVNAGNGSSSVQHQAITSTNADIILIRALGTIFRESFITKPNFSHKMMHSKRLSAK